MRGHTARLGKGGYATPRCDPQAEGASEPLAIPGEGASGPLTNPGGGLRAPATLTKGSLACPLSGNPSPAGGRREDQERSCEMRDKWDDRTALIPLDLTEAEYALLLARAAQQGLTLEEYCRRALGFSP
jgi:hypothetical protein